MYIATINSHLHGNLDIQATGKLLRSNKDRGSVGNLYTTSYCNVAVQEVDEFKFIKLREMQSAFQTRISSHYLKIEHLRSQLLLKHKVLGKVRNPLISCDKFSTFNNFKPDKSTDDVDNMTLECENDNQKLKNEFKEIIDLMNDCMSPIYKFAHNNLLGPNSYVHKLYQSNMPINNGPISSKEKKSRSKNRKDNKQIEKVQEDEKFFVNLVFIANKFFFGIPIENLNILRRDLNIAAISKEFSLQMLHQRLFPSEEKSEVDHPSNKKKKKKE